MAVALGLVSCERQGATWSPRDGDRIDAVEIRYSGESDIDPVRLTGFLHLSAGSAYTAEAVDRDLIALFESGLVEDVRVLAEPVGGDVRLVFEVETRPPFGPSLFVGNTAFSDPRFAHELGLKEGSHIKDLTDQNFGKFTATIGAFYRREGYPDASVTTRASDGGPATPDDFQIVIEEGEPRQTR